MGEIISTVRTCWKDTETAKKRLVNLFPGILHYDHFKMIFDYHEWEEESLNSIGSALASLYATVLVCVYIAFVLTEIFKCEENFKVAIIQGHTYSYVLFLAYV